MRTFRLGSALALALFACGRAAAQSQCDTINAAGHCVPNIDTVVRAAAVDRGASVGTTAVALIAANAARRGFAVQNQSATADCYISGQATATADWHSLKVAAGAYYETPPSHVGTGTVSIVCSGAATPVYAREW